MRLLSFFLCVLLLSGCTERHNEQDKSIESSETIQITQESIAETTMVTETTVPSDPVGDFIASMSLEERVGQLFLARCDDSVALEHIDAYHLGGFVLFGRDFQDQTPESFREKIGQYQTAAKIPLFLAVDEEGGTVARISSNPAFYESRLPSARDAFAWKGLDGNYIVEDAKCKLLQRLELNVNLGPVCDMTTNSAAFMYKRSLGQDVVTTSQYVTGTVNLMNANKIGSVLKHFPGYGNNADTHTGIAVDSRTLEELEGNDLIPFQAGIDAGCGGIMMSHTIVEALDPLYPVSLSPAAHEYIRQNMNFHGVLVTDDLVMQAITNQYGVEEAAVLAVLAGNDLLCSTEYMTQYEAVLSAVLDGRISIDILNTAVRNVLEWKMDLGLIAVE